MIFLFFQRGKVFFRFQTGNTAGTCGNDGLTELRIFNIAGGKKSGNAGCAAVWFGVFVSLVVKLNNALEQIGVRVVPYRDKSAGNRQFRNGVSLDVLEFKRCQAERFVAADKFGND